MEDAKSTRSIDLRPAVPAYAADWPAAAQEWVRTVEFRLGVFQMLVQARGLEDELTQQAWVKLATLIRHGMDVESAT